MTNKEFIWAFVIAYSVVIIPLLIYWAIPQRCRTCQKFVFPFQRHIASSTFDCSFDHGMHKRCFNPQTYEHTFHDICEHKTH